MSFKIFSKFYKKSKSEQPRTPKNYKKNYRLPLHLFLKKTFNRSNNKRNEKVFYLKILLRILMIS